MGDIVALKARHIILLDKGSPFEVSLLPIPVNFLLKTKCSPFSGGFSASINCLLHF